MGTGISTKNYSIYLYGVSGINCRRVQIGKRGFNENCYKKYDV